MGCDYNIIDHLEKFSQFALKRASFIFKFCGNSPEVANWVIMIMLSPRAKHDHNHLLGDGRGGFPRHRNRLRQQSDACQVVAHPGRSHRLGKF